MGAEEAPPTVRIRRPRAKTRLGQFGLTAFAVVGGACIIAIVGAPLEYSREWLPEPLHLAVLAVYATVIGYLLSWTATEHGRRSNLGRIVEWFGPYGLVLLPLLIMSISAFVLASLTATLFTHGWVDLAPGGAAEVNEGALEDFYLWHLLNLVPLAKIPQTLKWEEPVLYTQARVGWLLLLFQALVVVPCIGAIRWYWKHRHSLFDDSPETREAGAS